jgi:hypothetical protein
MTAPANQNLIGLDEYGKVWTSGWSCKCSFDRFHKDGKMKFNVGDRSSVAAPV